MTPQEKKFVEMAEKAESLNEQSKAAFADLEGFMVTNFPIGHTFQNEETKIVYRIEVPKGRYVTFSTIGYARTKKPGEVKGSLSMKDAEAAEFTVPKEGGKA